MKIEYVEKLPERSRNKLQSILDEFARTDKTVMKLTDEAGEYKSINSLCSSFAIAVKRSGRPWHVTSMDQAVYIVKDIGE